MFRKDFPVFTHHPDLIYMDSASTMQKPESVIQGMAKYLSTSYANIHRWSYDLSEQSEVLYEASKKKVAQYIWAKDSAEIVYTYNSTYAANLLAQSLRKSGWLKQGDTVVLNASDHHANIVPWLILKEEWYINVKVIPPYSNGTFDYDTFKTFLTPDVRCLSMTAASNVTGECINLKRISEILDAAYSSGERPYFVVDASQYIPHFPVDVNTMGIDFLFFTGHKIMADTGIGVLYGKKQLLKELQPAWCWGGAINEVHEDSYIPAGLPFRFEPGTPHIVWAVSLLLALEYIENIWGYPVLIQHEAELVQYMLLKIEQSKAFKEWRYLLLWPSDGSKRIGVFTFYFPSIHPHDVADMLADEWIAVRSWHHCTQPLHELIQVPASLRVSFALYNSKEDIDVFFEKFEIILSRLS